MVLAFFNGLPGFNPCFRGLPGPRLAGTGLGMRDDVVDMDVDVDLVQGLVTASFTALYPALMFLRIMPIFLQVILTQVVLTTSSC